MLVRSTLSPNTHKYADQGTTPKLSKFWLPLDKFTEQAMAGLCRGDVQICPGDSQDKWVKYEKGKIEQMAVNRT